MHILLCKMIVFQVPFILRLKAMIVWIDRLESEIIEAYRPLRVAWVSLNSTIFKETLNLIAWLRSFLFHYYVSSFFVLKYIILVFNLARLWGICCILWSWANFFVFVTIINSWLGNAIEEVKLIEEFLFHEHSLSASSWREFFTQYLIEITVKT